MKFGGFLGGFRSGNPVELRPSLPVWCEHCALYISELQTHGDDCPTVIEPLARKARARQRGEISFAAYLKLYGIMICLGAMGFVIWHIFWP